MSASPPRVRPLPGSLALLISPVVTACSAFAGPRLAGFAGLAAHADVVAFVLGTGSALLSLALAARDDRFTRALGASALAGMMLACILAFSGAGGLGPVLLVNASLVVGAHVVGGSIGRRVAHPGHLLPASAVAAAADLASVLHPDGPSHAIAGSDRALSLLAVAAPIAGTQAVAPVLGLGDLMFLALALGAAVKHGVSVARVALAGALGLAVAGGAAAVLGQEIPALVPIGAALVALVPEFRRVRAEDRRTTTVALCVAILVAASVLRTAVSGR